MAAKLLEEVEQEIAALNKEFGKSKEFQALDAEIGCLFIEYGERFHDCVATFEEANPTVDMAQLIGKLFMIQIKLAS
jgi:hypothetical protein